MASILDGTYLDEENINFDENNVPESTDDKEVSNRIYITIS